MLLVPPRPVRYGLAEDDKLPASRLAAITVQKGLVTGDGGVLHSASGETPAEDPS
jgi:hypothetical protein